MEMFGVVTPDISFEDMLSLSTLLENALKSPAV